MHTHFPKDVAKRFNDELKFVKTWIGHPKIMGAVLPTSSITAKRMASVIAPTSDARVLELGPGTGVLTKAIIERGIKPQNVYSVEFTQGFIPKLKREFPGVNFIHGDAFRLDEALPAESAGKFDAVISGLPLLNFRAEKRVELMQSLFDWLKPGHPLVQFSYGAVSPIPKRPDLYQTEPLEWIFRNVPPARIWTYRQNTN